MPPHCPEQSTHRPQVWFLFPKAGSVAKRRSLSNLLSWSGKAQSPTTSKKGQKSPGSHAISVADHSPAGGEGAHLQATSAGDVQDLGTSVDGEIVDSDTVDAPAIRGEGGARYRHSGTPVYELDAASLRSHDERVEQQQHQRIANDAPLDGTAVPPMSSVASSDTGTTRYFSASSDALATSVLSPLIGTGPAQNQLQHLRAVENGAPKVTAARTLTAAYQRQANGQTSPGLSGASNGTTQAAPNCPTPARPATQKENAFPLTPITITTHGTLCPHGKTTTPAPPAPLNPPLIRSATPDPIPNLDGQSVSPHDHPQHLRNIGRAKGTWRTRMQKTRCWRCEMHRYRMTGWARLRRMSEWTCFRRFKAYDEESEDEREEERMTGVQMAVLGSQG